MGADGPVITDRHRLLAAAALRAVGTSTVGVLLGIYLSEVGLGAGEIGAVSTAGLAGAALAALAVTLRGDRWGRRRTLVGLGLLSAVAGGAFLVPSTAGPLAALAAAGMLNAMGRDRSGAVILEQATLPETVPAERRTLAFAWYSALQDSGNALGSLVAGLPAALAALFGLSLVVASRATLAVYPLLMLATVPLYLGLSDRVEPAPRASVQAMSRGTRRIVTRISALFALDAIGGGFLVTTLLSYYFFERFDASAASVATLFFAARVANLGSNFGAAWLARRFGLVNTMVFTHIPSSLLLVAVAFVRSFELAAALYLMRECLVEMDVPTRQSYVMAVVDPESRTAASGVTNLVRLGGWAAGPVLAGLAMQHLSLGAPLVIGATIKIAYDVALFVAFRRLRPPEEAGRGS